MTETQTKWFNAGTVAAFLRGIARGIDLAAAEIENAGVPVGNPAPGAAGRPPGEEANAAPASNGSAGAEGATGPGQSEAGAETPPDAGGAASASESGTIDLDAEGIPWDARIHSGAKSKIKDGTWRLKKGAEPALVESVKAELKAAAATPPAEPPPDAGAQPDLGGIPEPPPIGATPPAEDGPKTFPEFMAALTPHLTAGKITQEQIDHAASKHGLNGGLELAQREDLIPAVLAECLTLCQTTQN